MNQLPGNPNSDDPKRYPNSKRLLIIGLVIFFFLTVFLFFLPNLVTKLSIVSLGVDDPNEIGDTLGGILGPYVALIAAALTFLAFYAQFAANVEQRKQFDKSMAFQKNAFEVEAQRVLKAQMEQKRVQDEQQRQIERQEKQTRKTVFETRFYTMLSIHRDNAKSIEVNKIIGGKVFVHMLDEMRFFYKAFEDYYLREFEVLSKEDEEIVYNMAYLTFFFGIGDKSTPMVKDLVGSKYEDFLEKSHDRISDAIYIFRLDGNVEIQTRGETLEWKPIYNLGTGHLRRLSHYIRHLFQIVKYVDDQPNELIDSTEKYNYISNLRAQLSVHEQLILFYNSLSVLGKPWRDKDADRTESLIERYCLIKSVPLNLFEFYRTPIEIYPERNMARQPMYEWVVIKSRMAQLYSRAVD